MILWLQRLGLINSRASIGLLDYHMTSGCLRSMPSQLDWKSNMSAIYKGLEFKTRLEAQWAAFFDLAGWSWWSNPAAVGNWRPDFKVSFECDHSECNGEHTLLVAVLPAADVKAFDAHPCLAHAYGVKSPQGEWLADGGAAFGSSPSVTRWVIAHGAGGGVEDVHFRVANANARWAEAEGLVK